jgi:ABC-2 type transport system ATP-binding protein
LQSRSRYHNAVSVSVPLAGDQPAGAVRAELSRLANVAEVEQSAAINGTASFVVVPQSGKPILAEVSQCIRAKGWQVAELKVETGRLDEVFRTVTSGPKGGKA